MKLKIRKPFENHSMELVCLLFFFYLNAGCFLWNRKKIGQKYTEIFDRICHFSATIVCVLCVSNNIYIFLFVAENEEPIKKLHVPHGQEFNFNISEQTIYGLCNNLLRKCSKQQIGHSVQFWFGVFLYRIFREMHTVLSKPPQRLILCFASKHHTKEILKLLLFCFARRIILNICAVPTVRSVFRQLYQKLNKQLLEKNALIESNNG